MRDGGPNMTKLLEDLNFTFFRLSKIQKSRISFKSLLYLNPRVINTTPFKRWCSAAKKLIPLNVYLKQLFYSYRELNPMTHVGGADLCHISRKRPTQAELSWWENCRLALSCFKLERPVLSSAWASGSKYDNDDNFQSSRSLQTKMKHVKVWSLADLRLEMERARISWASAESELLKSTLGQALTSCFD